ncbi:hypothetical protein ACFSFZ_13635 [Mixta tenebrionis]|uniref:hypothetical protein n=1 Tax=Mixta tenebrionis TaxID=2562439 RepID=UPI001363F080|nr:MULTISPECIES: hypothetical protein [Mixta]
MNKYKSARCAMTSGQANLAHHRLSAFAASAAAKSAARIPTEARGFYAGLCNTSYFLIK